MAGRRTPAQQPPEQIPDPLADLRETDTAGLITDADREPRTADTDLEYLPGVETLEEAIPLALIQATPENMDALGAQLLAFIQSKVTDADGNPVAVVSSQKLVTEDEQELVRVQMIQAWHNDTVATGFLHKGGACGCRYLATCVLQIVLPAEAEEETSDLRDDNPEE